MALCDTWSLQHLMRFRRRSATRVVDATENFHMPALVRPHKLVSPFRTAGSEVAMALRDRLSLQHLMRFRRRSATSVVDASENFY